MTAKPTIRVWVRSLGNGYRFRLESEESGQWLLERLKEQDALAGLGPVEIQTTDAGCRFQIPNADQRTLDTLERALKEIAGVELMLSPDAS